MTAGVLALALSMIAPAIMAAEGWDDHDRSDRYFSVDSAKNFLASCQPNAIIFTGGDNDTFPLWYVQEVEGFRTDVRVVVLSYFNTDWYIEQMMNNAYESQPLPFGLPLKAYEQGGRNDYLPLLERPNLKNGIDAKQFIDLIRKEQMRISEVEVIRQGLIKAEQSGFSSRSPEDIVNAMIARKQANGEI